MLQCVFSMKTVGIIGFGSFGKFLAEKLSSHAKVLVYSQSGRTSSWMTSLEEVAAVDYLILSIPLDAYNETLTALKPHLTDRTVLVDVCSVKVKPIAKIREILPLQPLVATHPLFGPESAAVSLDGHTFVMCPELSTPEPYLHIKRFADSLGLKVVEMSAEEHDRELAVVHGLTFFIARSLEEMNIHDQKLHTPTFQRLLNIVEVDRHHSPELFRTIQNGNDYARDMRRRFIDTAQRVNKELEVEK